MLNDLSAIKRNLCEREYTFDELPKEIMYMSEINIELFEFKINYHYQRKLNCLTMSLMKLCSNWKRNIVSIQYKLSLILTKSQRIKWSIKYVKNVNIES